MKILITGATGFIGRNVLKELYQKKNDITAIVRTKTPEKKLLKIKDKVNLVEIDLADIKRLKEYLSKNSFDLIMHIGALRGGRKFDKKTFIKVNIDATEQLLLNAKENSSKFIFCSSVGVFGAIPSELPANELTPRNPDNTYHFTKIESEKLIQKYSLRGVKAYIVRPAITYGKGDYGFPFTLVKLIDKKMLPISLKRTKIHLTNVELLASAFKKLSESDFPTGSTFIVADYEPVDFWDLVDFISNKINNSNYPVSRFIHPKYFDWGERISKFFHSELWLSRFELISKSWYYDVNDSYEKLNLKKIQTIPEFKVVIDWYKSLKGE